MGDGRPGEVGVCLCSQKVVSPELVNEQLEPMMMLAQYIQMQNGSSGRVAVELAAEVKGKSDKRSSWVSAGSGSSSRSCKDDLVRLVGLSEARDEDELGHRLWPRGDMVEALGEEVVDALEGSRECAPDTKRYGDGGPDMLLESSTVSDALNLEEDNERRRFMLYGWLRGGSSWSCLDPVPSVWPVPRWACALLARMNGLARSEESGCARGSGRGRNAVDPELYGTRSRYDARRTGDGGWAAGLCGRAAIRHENKVSGTGSGCRPLEELAGGYALHPCQG